METTQAFSFTQLLDFKTMGLTPKPSGVLSLKHCDPWCRSTKKTHTMTTTQQNHFSYFTPLHGKVNKTKMNMNNISNPNMGCWFCSISFSTVLLKNTKRIKWVRGTLLLLWFFCTSKLKKGISIRFISFG